MIENAFIKTDHLESKLIRLIKSIDRSKAHHTDQECDEVNGVYAALVWKQGIEKAKPTEIKEDRSEQQLGRRK